MNPSNQKPTPKTSREIVEAAWAYLKEIPGIGKLSNARVEELEKLDINWKVVISYDTEGDFPFEKSRSYKEFTVDGETGTVLSMKIKTI